MILGVNTRLPVTLTSLEGQSSSDSLDTVITGLRRTAQPSKLKRRAGAIPWLWQGILTHCSAKVLEALTVTGHLPVESFLVLMQSLKSLVQVPLETKPSSTMVKSSSQGPGTSARKKCSSLSQSMSQSLSQRRCEQLSSQMCVHLGVQGHLVISAIIPERSAKYLPFCRSRSVTGKPSIVTSSASKEEFLA